MSISIKHMVLAASVLVAVCVPVFSADLTIDANSTPRFWVTEQAGTMMYGDGPVMPTRLAVLYVVRNELWLPSDISSAILSSPTGKSLSQQQKDFLVTGLGILRLDRYSVNGINAFYVVDKENRPFILDEIAYMPGCYCVLLYAVTEDDCKKTVKAFVEAMEAEATAASREAERNMVECEVAKARTQQKIDNVQSNIQDIVNNRGIMSSPEDISRMISTTEELKNSLSIDVAGLNARIEAIMKFIAAKDTAPEVRTRLQQMLVDHNIELAGVLAKLKATDEARDKAEQKYMFSLRLGELRKESGELKAQFMKAEKQAQDAGMVYDRARDKTVHPQIFQNKATIYPVKTEK